MSGPDFDAPRRLSTSELWRDIFREPITKERLRRLGHLFVLTGRKAGADEIGAQSAALAFITLVSLVPLLASLSHFGAAFLFDDQDDFVALVARVLPYTQEAIESTMRQFVEQSQSLRGFGLVAFLFTALVAFSTIERIINQIWNVAESRPLRSRLNSFVLLLCYGPLLIGLTYSGLFVLGRNRTFEELTASVPLQLVPFVVTALGLTMLYWQVPYTRVDLRAALAGGVLASLALEALHAGFGYYVDVAQQVSVVYGSFGAAFFFMLSIDLSWVIVLLGSTFAYCVQNFTYLERPRRRAATIEGSWLGLAAMVLVVDCFRRGRPVVSHEKLAADLNLQPTELSRTLAPLVEAKFLCEHGGDADGYLLSCDPYTTRIDDIIDVYEEQQWQILQPLPDHARESLLDLRHRLSRCRDQATERFTLMDLLQTEDDDEAIDLAAEAGTGAGTETEADAEAEAEAGDDEEAA